MLKINFVCLGNICRSPMAEFIAKKIIKDKKLNDVVITSSGVSNFHEGEFMHHGTQMILDKYQIPYDDFHSKPITQTLFDENDLILVMDENNRLDLIKKFHDATKIKKITDYSTLDYHEVPDPWYTNNFEETYTILLNCINNFLI